MIRTAYGRKVYWGLWFYKVRIHDGGAEAVAAGMPSEVAAESSVWVLNC